MWYQSPQDLLLICRMSWSCSVACPPCADLEIALLRYHSPNPAMAVLQAEQSKASTAADVQPDISPLIAMEQSSAEVSAADLAGTPAEVVQEPFAASKASADMPGGKPGGLCLRGLC